ncbi:TIGR00270 family protein [Candidatus Bathyarchaeota archaeon]|nr:TIGR00270 family protein [Candidatus Bathyarchaeota archaeon]
MQCEVCGRKIYGEGYRRIIDGARLIVCSECAKLGVADWSESKPPSIKKAAIKPKPRRVRVRRPSIVEGLELVEGFGGIVRKARLKAGLSYEDLGKKIGEKASVLRRVEKESITPDEVLARKLEHALHIKLLVKNVYEEKVKLPPVRPAELTLGDVVRLKVREEES